MRREVSGEVGVETAPEADGGRLAIRKVRPPFCTWRGLLGLVAVTAIGAAVVNDDGASPAATGPKGRALIGHSGLIDTLRFSGDGRTLVSAGADRTIRVWGLDDSDGRFGAELARLSMDEDVSAAAVSPNGRTVAVAGFDGPLLWDWGVDGQIRRPSRSMGATRSVAFAPDGGLLAVGGYGGELLLVDVATCRVTADLPNQHGVVRDVAFTADGERLFALNSGGRLRTWDVASRREVEALSGLDDRARPILTFALSPDGRDLAVTRLKEYDGRVEVWDVASGTSRTTCQAGPGGMIHALTFSSDGAVLAACGTNQAMSFWNPRTGKSAGVLEEVRGWVRALDFAVDGRWMATSSRPDEVLLRRIGLPRRHTAFAPPTETRRESSPREAGAA